MNPALILFSSDMYLYFMKLSNKNAKFVNDKVFLRIFMYGGF